MITALAGGVGAARFLQGAIKVVPQNELTVIVNTGDDIELFGLHISPDIDIVTYTLAGLVDEEKGWGVKGDSFNCLKMLGRYGYETWFQLGDMDLATHIHRTLLLRKGMSLSEATYKISRSLGLKVKIIPMTNEKFRTFIKTDKGLMHFQEFLVKRKAKDKVLGIVFKGSGKAKPSPDVINSIINSEIIIICPSNPIVSIGTILSLRGVREALKETCGVVAGVSPIIRGAPLKGPADILMKALNIDVSAYSVAKLYRDFLDVFVIDNQDRDQIKEIASLGIKVYTTNTIMKTLKDKVRLARFTIEKAKQCMK